MHQLLNQLFKMIFDRWYGKENTICTNIRNILFALEFRIFIFLWQSSSVIHVFYIRNILEFMQNFRKQQSSTKRLKVKGLAILYQNSVEVGAKPT